MQLRGGGAPHGHEVEVPAEQGALLDHPVDVLLGGHRVRVGARPAARDAKGQLVGAQKVHGALDLDVGALPAAGVGGVLVALGRDGRHEVAHADHVLAEVLVDERGVREAEKRAVRVPLADLDEVMLAHERLAARVDVHVGAELLALCHDRVDVLERQVLLVAVLRGPAAGAVQVAGARGVQQDRPGDVSLVLLARPLLDGPGQQVAVDEQGLQQLGAHLGVQPEHAHHKLVPVATAGDDVRECLALHGEHAVRHELVDELHDLVDVLFGILVEVVDELVERRALGGLSESHACLSFALHRDAPPRRRDFTALDLCKLCSMIPLLCLM